MSEKDTLILAIESSCDETAASVVKNGRCVLSNIISSQIAIHTLYGGVVPEIASRKHIEKINQVVEAALKEADVTLDDIDAIGVTYGPGLVGALLVGVAEAKAIAYAKKKPLVGVHHIEGHVSANYIEHPDLEPPFLCEIISGGHTHLVIVKDYGSFEILGRTRDDAAGEAFDKVARAIGLGYPGGPKQTSLRPSSRPLWTFWWIMPSVRPKITIWTVWRSPAALHRTGHSARRWKQHVKKRASAFTVRLRSSVPTMRP